MDNLKIAELKDSVLTYLYKMPKNTTLIENLHQNVQGADEMSLSVFIAYLEELAQEKLLDFTPITGNRKLITLLNKGKKFLSEGGFTKSVKIELEDTLQKQFDDQKFREKTEMEIKNLQASIKNYRFTKTYSIIAFIISILTFLYSILFKAV